VDCARLKVKGISDLFALVRCCDPGLMTAEPAARPCEVGALTGLSEYGEANDEWLNQFPKDLESLFVRAMGDDIVIAERSFLVRNTRHRPTEVRCSAFTLTALDGQATLATPEGVFGSLVKSTVAGYEKENVGREEEKIILFNHVYDLDSPGADWLALNPAFAQHMVWQRDYDHSLAWVDSTGKPMARSCWWRDGTPEDSCHGHDGEFGEGMLVMASQEGFRQIAEKLPDLRVAMCVQRTIEHTKASSCKVHITSAGSEK